MTLVLNGLELKFAQAQKLHRRYLRVSKTPTHMICGFGGNDNVTIPITAALPADPACTIL